MTSLSGSGEQIHTIKMNLDCSGGGLGAKPGDIRWGAGGLR